MCKWLHLALRSELTSPSCYTAGSAAEMLQGCCPTSSSSIDKVDYILHIYIFKAVSAHPELAVVNHLGIFPKSLLFLFLHSMQGLCLITGHSIA